jgi:hypothetical protein
VLGWTEVESRVSGYNIYGTVKGTVRLLASVPSTTTKFTHSGLTNGVAYSYQVSAVDLRGIESGLSNVATAIPGGRTFPSLQTQSISLYPNPAVDEISLHGEIQNEGSYSATIMNAYGLPMGKQRVYLERGEVASNINITTLSSGIYVLRLTDAQGNVVATLRFEKK